MKFSETTGETPVWSHSNNHRIARKLKTFIQHPFTFIVLVWALLLVAFYVATEFI